ncbi:MarR family transcriptional regulator [Streptomyces sp. CB01881]|uniref:MarR family winged helix-turn-helix transcriptional regulator n=1 Tax=Streptomyces sp. CB01881 TaxID=2078691 RepID=UPI000CDBE849|nr:MarR family transcriptional regulator [Streptomyces sp. CB01881]AUY52275.1 MarR family transcriptional regulator [Streptomyces sp. CB01881]TYC71697.1 MarR family transcriptional regulator [Streptomyces sp. CB01881]
MSPSPPVPDPAAGPQREAAERPDLALPADGAPQADLAPRTDSVPQADLAPPAIERARRLTDVVTRLRRALRSSIRTDYPWESLPMAQVELLQSLAAAPLRVGELAARQRLAPNTVSGLVGKLLEAGFVDRQADPGDRRTARIALTPAGRRQLDDWQRAHERRIAAALDTLSPADREAVMQALPALDNLARALARPAAPE